MSKRELKLTIVHELGRVLKGEEPRICFVIDALPRGGGHRAMMVRLGEAFRDHARIGPHVIKVDARSSRLRVWLRPSIGLMKDVLVITQQVDAEREVAQGRLFPA